MRKIFRFHRGVAFALASGIGLIGSLAPAAEPIKSIEVWVRPRAGAAGRGPRRTVDLDTLKTNDASRKDPQYGKTYTFRAIPLSVVLEKADPPRKADLALLHFANGMAVPLPLRDRDVSKRLDPWLARAIIVDGKDQPLPPVTRKAQEYVDVPAIVFTGNKVVVAEGFHPAVDPAAQPGFSPWAFTDSLVGIEFVTADPYYAQFDVDRSPAVREGLAIFKQNCQFCHGARHVGAKFGWDFVEPEPMYLYRASPKQLFFHARYQRPDATERGLMMPALKHMTEHDAATLWYWLKAIGRRPMRGYAVNRELK